MQWGSWARPWALLRRLQGERDAARRHRRPAGHAPPDGPNPGCPGDLVVKWAKELRRGEDVGQALRRAFAIARTPPCGPVFLSLDILDQEVSGPTPPASAPPRLRRRGVSRRGASRPSTVRSGAGHRPARGRPARGGERGAGRVRGTGAFLVWGTQLASRTAFPSAHPCWASEARFRRHGAFEKRHRRSCWSAGAPSSPTPIATRSRFRRRRRSAYRRQPGGVRARARSRTSGASRRHRPDPRPQRRHLDTLLDG